MKELTFQQLKNTKFISPYKRLLTGAQLDDREIAKLIAVAVILLNQKSKLLGDLGYRIILANANASGRYDALYQFAGIQGLAPVTAVIEAAQDIQRTMPRDSFISLFSRSHTDTFRDGSKFLTEQQMMLRDFTSRNQGANSVIVAPTSYGKSEIIVRHVLDHPTDRTLIIVPSKALLSQTKKRLIDAKIPSVGKILTHPDMYSPDRQHAAFVLTQERALRLLCEHRNLSFNKIFVDEAHNLLESDSRAKLLATVISIIYERNTTASFTYLTPFLCDSNSLNLRHGPPNLNDFHISEYVKSERFYSCDFREGKSGEVFLYDQFIDIWMKIPSPTQSWQKFITSRALGKNIIYANKPKHIEQIAKEISNNLEIARCEIIDKACSELEEMFGANYHLINCLRHGVMYHHGSVPENVRTYLEWVYSRSSKMRFLVCNTTLMEGVNLPAERLFLLDNKAGRRNLTPAKLKNLVGRINRFNDVFREANASSLKRLEPSIYVIGTDDFISGNANLQSFLKDCTHVPRSISDDVKNILLSEAKIDDDQKKKELQDARDRLFNIEPSMMPKGGNRAIELAVGRLMLANGITEIDPFKCEHSIDSKVNSLVSRRGQISSTNELLSAIGHCFIEEIPEGGHEDLRRVLAPQAQDFYAMLLNWRIGHQSMRQSIRSTVSYWNDRVSMGRGDYVFVGKWGDRKYSGSNKTHWVDMGTKSASEMANLAIVRIKEEEDFLDYKIMRFAEVLNGVGAIDQTFYKMVKYGTKNEIEISLIQEGFSRSLSRLITNKYINFVSLSANGSIEVNPKALNAMKSREESELIIFEASLNLGTPV